MEFTPMKKLTMAAFAGTALLALAACADPDETEEPVVEETTVIDETVTPAPTVTETAVVDGDDVDDVDDVDDEPDVEATIGPEPEATIRSD